MWVRLRTFTTVKALQIVGLVVGAEHPLFAPDHVGLPARCREVVLVEEYAC
eukprot:SAG11_NODE_2285_length_3571_cov_2.005184_4_plen_51_part_00